MKKKSIIIVIIIIIILGFIISAYGYYLNHRNSNNENINEEEKNNIEIKDFVFDSKRDSYKISNIKIIYNETATIKQPLTILDFINNGFKINNSDIGISPGMTLKENDKLIFPDESEYLTITAYNYSNDIKSYGVCTIVHLENESELLSIYGIIPKKTTYEQVIELLGKDKTSRNNDFVLERENGSVVFEYIGNIDYEGISPLVYNNKTYNQIKLEIYFNDIGIVEKIILNWI